jgi:hypothetical protein
MEGTSVSSTREEGGTPPNPPGALRRREALSMTRHVRRPSCSYSSGASAAAGSKACWAGRRPWTQNHHAKFCAPRKPCDVRSLQVDAWASVQLEQEGPCGPDCPRFDSIEPTYSASRLKRTTSFQVQTSRPGGRNFGQPSESGRRGFPLLRAHPGPRVPGWQIR